MPLCRPGQAVLLPESFKETTTGRCLQLEDAQTLSEDDTASMGTIKVSEDKDRLEEAASVKFLVVGDSGGDLNEGSGERFEERTVDALCLREAVSVLYTLYCYIACDTQVKHCRVENKNKGWT